jgi:hypothetical protein
MSPSARDSRPRDSPTRARQRFIAKTSLPPIAGPSLHREGQALVATLGEPAWARRRLGKGGPFVPPINAAFSAAGLTVEMDIRHFSTAQILHK